MAKGRVAKNVKSKLAFLLYGEQGTWKSSLCLDFMRMKTEDEKPFKVLYIDCESGSIDDYIELLDDENIDTRNLYILYTQSLKEVIEYINKIAKKEDLYELDEDGNETEDIILDANGQPFRPDAIVIDGTTVLYMTQQESLLRLSEKRASVKAKNDNLTGDEKFVKIQNANLEFKDWNRIKFAGNDLILALLSAGVHFVVTAREQDEKETYKVNGQIQSVSTGRKIPSGFKDLAYNVKTVIRTYTTEDGVVNAQIEAKDRTGICMQGQILEKPSLLLWQQVIDKSKNKEDFILSNNMEKSISKDQEIYKKELGLNDTNETQQEIISDRNKIYQEIVDYYKNTLTPAKKKGFIPKVKQDFPNINTTKDISNISDIQTLLKILEIIKQL